MDYLLIYHLAKRRMRKQRRLPNLFVTNRLLSGEFVTKFSKLRDNENEFYKYLKLSTKTYDELFSKLEPYLKAKNQRLKSMISPMEKLTITLRYLASGHTFVDLHLAYQAGETSIRNIVHEVCKTIWLQLKEECFPEFTPSKWEDIAEGFLINANFPNCLGAVDGKHIRIIKPPHSGSLYYNYKHYYSIVLLAMCNANYEFTYINVGMQGKESDSAIFTKSNFFRQVNTGLLNIPPPKALPILNENKPTNIAATTPMPYVIVGDEAFGLSSHVMRPYARSISLSYDKKVFNYRLTRARRYIESTFGIMANKFRILHRPLNVSKMHGVGIVKAICILHNFTRSREGHNNINDNVILPHSIHNISSGLRETNRQSFLIRDKFANYFVTHGKVSWQDRCIH